MRKDARIALYKKLGIAYLQILYLWNHNYDPWEKKNPTNQPTNKKIQNN